MSTRPIHCRSCGHTSTAATQVFAKVGLGGAGLLFGSATRNPLGALIGVCLGAAIGHYIDRELLPRCPGCGIALNVLGTALG